MTLIFPYSLIACAILIKVLYERQVELHGTIMLSYYFSKYFNATIKYETQISKIFRRNKRNKKC